MGMATNNSDSNSTSLSDVFYGNSGIAQNASGISTRAFFLNLATGFVLFSLQLSGFLLLKSSRPGRRLYQPKTYLVQKRLRVEAIPVSPLKWLRRIFSIRGVCHGNYFDRFIFHCAKHRWQCHRDASGSHHDCGLVSYRWLPLCPRTITE